TKGATDNTPKPIAQKTTNIFNAPLFTINLASGLRFSPILKIDVGAEVNSPTSLSVPLNSNLEITLRAGVVDGEPYYDQS
ncbi:hypothetical protein, partial [Pseudomonas sp. CCC2.2]|uniref:hypothetical protein n=1 Tax=Pseudomonas sp. CCC2.2 TaxID=3048605 RepID=UPI002B238C1B